MKHLIYITEITDLDGLSRAYDSDDIAQVQNIIGSPRPRWKSVTVARFMAELPEGCWYAEDQYGDAKVIRTDRGELERTAYGPREPGGVVNPGGGGWCRIAIERDGELKVRDRGRLFGCNPVIQTTFHRLIPITDEIQIGGRWQITERSGIDRWALAATVNEHPELYTIMLDHEGRRWLMRDQGGAFHGHGSPQRMFHREAEVEPAEDA